MSRRPLRCTAFALLLALAGIAFLRLPADAAVAAPNTSSSAVMILLDVNRSPFKAFLIDERAAIRGYVDALKPGVKVGLISFSNHWRLVLAPTGDHARLDSALKAVKTAGPSSLGLARAISGAAAEMALAGSSGNDRLLVLSDGEDVQHSVAPGRIPIDVLTWSSDADDNVAAIKALAHATGGRVGDPANAAALTGIFASTPSVKPSPAKSTGASTGTATSTRVSSAVKKTPVWLIAGVFLILFLLAVIGLRALRPGDQGRRRLLQLERYGPRGALPANAEVAGDSKAAGAVMNLASRFLRSSNAEPRLAARLDIAGISRKPAEWALLGASATIVLIALLVILTGNALVAIPLGGLCGWLGMRLLLSVRISRRRTAFARQLPDMLQLVAGSLQAGFSLPQAFDGVTREDTQPSSGEIARALAETRLGAEIDDALSGVAERMDSDDMRWTVMAIRIQREVGGNLAEVLLNTVDTMRERAFLRRQVRSLSGEGRLSAWILGGIPVVLAAWLFYSSPSYMEPLYKTAYGLLMLGGAGVLFVLGVLWMRVLIRVEV
jgi:tight adherence protein B